jgi:hypothetical protein
MKIIALLLIFLISCRSHSPEQAADVATTTATKSTKAPATTTPPVFTSPAYSCNYDLQKKRCEEIFDEHKKKKLPATKRKLISYIADSILPCWYGTPWDYNGITEVPGQGKIACGYFVTTTLRDAGMKINRYKMAQCVTQNLLYDLCTDFKKFSNKPLDYFVKEVEKAGYGLYIVGLDNHTGYIYHDGNEVWFIHSGILPPRCTIKEKAIASETLRRSAYRVLGRIIL